MRQTKKQSMIETVLNVTIGYIVAILSQIVVFPMFDINIEFKDNLLIGGYFTVISIIRGYFIRRLFNKIW